jgi:hypothetical protein
MILELYGVDEDEQDVRIEFKNLQAIHVFSDTIEVVEQNGIHRFVAYGYMDDNNIFWRTVPMYVNGRLNPDYEDYQEFSGLNIIS